MLQKRGIVLLALIAAAQFSFAQKKELLQLKEFYSLPGKDKPLAGNISAKASFSATPDSLFFEIDVTDDVVVDSEANGKGDEIQISFALPNIGFNDFIIGEKGAKKFIFRNSADPGDNADIERFIKNGDYPSGKLKNPEKGLSASPEVPPIKALKKQQLNFGITKFALFTNGKKAVQLEKEFYEAFELQVGSKLDDLSDAIKYRCSKVSGGYHLNIAIANHGLGFGNIALMDQLSFAIDVIDIDNTTASAGIISSTPNRFMGRPSYFNKINLPFTLNIALPGVPNEIISKTAIKIDAFRSENKWKPFTFNNGPVIYADGFLSEAGLIEYVFFPQKIAYTANENPKYETLELIYDDLAFYDQHEYYFAFDQQIISSKKFRFNKTNANDFLNRAFILPNGKIGIVLYDFEAVDPLGWGENGKTADEFVYIQQLETLNSNTIYSIGMRIDATESITLGEKNPLNFRNVKDINFKWIEMGKTFSVLIKRVPETYNEEVKFEILPSLEIRKLN
jgi:hypothetical protein